jgi:hypothetical protein
MDNTFMIWLIQNGRAQYELVTLWYLCVAELVLSYKAP